MHTGALATLAAEQPKITDWLSVWFTLGSGAVALAALIVAGFAAKATIATNRNQSEQLRRLEETQAGELASKFGVWISSREEADQFEQLHARYYLSYQNTASLPIYNTMTVCNTPEVDKHFKESKQHFWQFGTVGPTTQASELGDRDDRLDEALRGEILIAEQVPVSHLSDEVQMRHRHFVDESSSIEILAQETKVSLYFTDGNGLHWYRQHDGKLTQLNEAKNLYSAILKLPNQEAPRSQTTPPRGYAKQRSRSRW